MLRPIRHLLIPVITVLALAGCGSSAGGGPSETSSPKPSSTAPSSTTPSVAPSSTASSSPAAAPSSPAATSLTVEFRAGGTDVTDTYYLECDGGTPVGDSAAPDPAAACAALAARGAELFALPNPALMCTQQYNGPQLARVSGTVQGVSVNGDFSLKNGCEIGRWESLTGLLGPAEAAM